MTNMTKIKMKYALLVALIVCFVGAQMLAPTPSLADVLKCKIDGFSENIFITTPPAWFSATWISTNAVENDTYDAAQTEAERLARTYPGIASS
jgi:hypothetical protein